MLNEDNAFDAVRNTASTILSVRNGNIIMQKEPEKVLTTYKF